MKVSASHLFNIKIGKKNSNQLSDYHLIKRDLLVEAIFSIHNLSVYQKEWSSIEDR